MKIIKNAIDFIEDLALAGVRFVFFSAAPVSESKAYAERLGIEMDWNSCIILSSNDKTPGYVAAYDMNARLPKGVENIRNHLQNVDDVPLHVSLFADCQRDSIFEMIKIFQENEEVVCVVGSSLNIDNLKSFAKVFMLKQANVSISIDPIYFSRQQFDHPVSSILISAALNTSPCALSLAQDSSLYNITQVLREARIFRNNNINALTFYVSVQLLILALIGISYCALLPRILTGYQIIFLLWLITPLLSFSILFTPEGSDVMTHMPLKSHDMFRYATYYWVFRFALVPIPSCLVSFYMALREGNYFTSYEDQILLNCQNYLLIVVFVHVCNPI